MGQEWSKIHQIAWKFRTQNLVATYILTLRTNLEYLLESILDILYTFWNSRSQELNTSNNLQIGVEMKKLWPFEDNFTKLKGHFEIKLMNSKFNLWIQNPIQNDQFTHCHFDVLPLLPQELHLGHSIRPKWPHTTRNHHFIIIF